MPARLKACPGRSLPCSSGRRGQFRAALNIALSYDRQSIVDRPDASDRPGCILDSLALLPAVDLALELDPVPVEHIDADRVRLNLRTPRQCVFDLPLMSNTITAGLREMLLTTAVTPDSSNSVFSGLLLILPVDLAGERDEAFLNGATWTACVVGSSCNREIMLERPLRDFVIRRLLVAWIADLDLLCDRAYALDPASSLLDSQVSA